MQTMLQNKKKTLYCYQEKKVIHKEKMGKKSDRICVTFRNTTCIN
jgi:hypothetical protein